MNKLKKVYCALFGHSKIIEFCIGEVSCARCNEVIGDTLTKSYNMKDKVIVGHKCDKCLANYKKLSFFRDKFLTKKPF